MRGVSTKFSAQPILAGLHKIKDLYTTLKCDVCLSDIWHGKCSRLLVGAPRGNSTYRKHRGIYQPGVVYQCGLDNVGDCQQILMNSESKFC